MENMQWIANFWRKPGPSGFGASSTAEEATQGVDATGITAIVTGGTSGIGRETVRVLALRGAEVIMPARNIQAGQKIKEEILKDNPNAKVDVMELDLGSLHSVRKFAEAFKTMGRPLNILVNNAGIMACPFQLSNEGIELQFATNHLGHFLLTNLLLDKIKATANTTGIEGRIINVSSAAHMRTYPEGVRLDKINNEEGYKPMASYGQSKLANILHMNELSRHLREEGANVTANSLHPGVIPTNIIRYIKILDLDLYDLAAFPMAIAKFMLKNAQEGAATTCFLALHPYVEGVSGKYYSDCNEAVPSSHAQDPVLAKELWRLSEDFISEVNEAD